MPNIAVRKFTKGDRLVSLYAQLVDADGVAINLTGQTVTFFMEEISSATSKVNGSAVTVVTPSTGHVRYDWASADVDTAAHYDAWFVRTSGGLKAHHPGQGKYLRVVFVDAEGAA
jgi:hypothetical protein